VREKFSCRACEAITQPPAPSIANSISTTLLADGGGNGVEKRTPTSPFGIRDGWPTIRFPGFEQSAFRGTPGDTMALQRSNGNFWSGSQHHLARCRSLRSDRLREATGERIFTAC
jgi:hypothetical protein